MHIGRVHMHQKAKTDYAQFDKDFIRDFVGFAKSNERITLDPAIHDYITRYYVFQR
jgi:DNA replicative helicase MCM subunit Mcm2 (Cdc46/Mcm family)